MPVIHADGKDAEWDDVACECSNFRLGLVGLGRCDDRSDCCRDD